MTASPYLNLLRNHIDIARVPFSDRGSRLLVFREPGQSKLLVKLAERLTEVQPDIEAYLHRPPFIRGLCLVDEEGETLDFEVVTYPHLIYFHTRLGDFGLVFQDSQTLAFGLPPQATAGLRFHVSPQFWEQTEYGGVFKSVRNLAYASNGETVRNRITPQGGGYAIEFVVQAGDDCAITLTVGGGTGLYHDVLPFSASSTAAESRWREWFSRVPPVVERYRRTYAYAWWIMANNLISPLGRVAYEAMTPSKINYVGLWLWDSAMHALAYRHVDPELARNQIRGLQALRKQLGVEGEMHFVFESGPEAGQPFTIDARVVGDLLRLGDVMFMPSHREGFGMPVLEAGLAGVPVVCTNVPAAAEIGGKNVTVFNSSADPARLAGQILTWAEQSPVHRLRRRVRQYYTWRAIFRRDIRPLLDGEGET
jgi:hypothetical protein